MEILFGQMRPTVIHRGTTTVNHNHPDYGYGFHRGYGYGFYGYAYPRQSPRRTGRWIAD